MRVTTLDDGKYTIENDNGTLNFKRHGEAWPAADDLRYTKIVSVMVHRIEELEDALALEKVKATERLMAECSAADKKRVELQDVVDNLHERLENVVAANNIPMPDSLRAPILAEVVESARDALAPHISYEPLLLFADVPMRKGE